MNVFEGGGGRHLEMTNGGTGVFVDVLTLAVSALANEPWHFRFAALLTLQDQSVMGRGVVGFGLAELDWGDTQHGQMQRRSSAASIQSSSSFSSSKELSQTSRISRLISVRRMGHIARSRSRLRYSTKSSCEPSANTMR